MKKTTRHTVDHSRIDFISSRAGKIFRQRIDPITDFSQLRTLHSGDDLSLYGKQVVRYSYDHPVEQVWKGFTDRPLHELWSGFLVQYLFAFSEEYNGLYYGADEYSPMVHEGLQVYCMLNIAGPVGVVGMKVLELNPEKFRIELAYMEGGLFRGTQHIEMVEQVLGGTLVIHTSYYKPEKVWGKLLPYKFFHKRTADEFHNTTKNYLNKSNRYEKAIKK